MDWKLELVIIPVSDVDRAKAFYTDKVGFNVDHDHRVSDEVRFVQLTPPGSACSIAIGRGSMEDGARLGEGHAGGRRRRRGGARRARSSGAWRSSEVQDFPWGSFVFFDRPRRERLGSAAAPAAPGRVAPPPFLRP